MAYHDWDPEHESIEITAYSVDRKWTKKNIIRAIFDYPFNVMGVRNVVARHSEKNRVRRIWRALGAEEYVLKDVWAPGVAMCIAVLSRDAWRKFEERMYGQA